MHSKRLNACAWCGNHLKMVWYPVNDERLCSAFCASALIKDEAKREASLKLQPTLHEEGDVCTCPRCQGQ